MTAPGDVHGTGARTPAIAFFDVDETLIGPKSMFSFLEFRFTSDGREPSAYDRAVADLRAMAAGGAPRQDVNRAYYRLMAGESTDRLRGLGRAWFETASARAGFWHPPVVERLRRHRDQGDLVVLLSGSFFACLEPIAGAVGANWALGTRPVARDGRTTGEVVVPMIGATKGTAARAAAAVRGVPLADCTAYGDHSSDLSLLSAVGHPVAVGDDSVLGAHADRHGWERIRDVSAPAVAATAAAG
ncbi:HAD family hydrolase [Nocardiopsis sp. CNR-923]|uniref:HAD family hydrolase n=1 Tax=Nocardiopsis sp. CNR-923 TaxID=1904965 RepID=UPI000962C8D8|nr:HAD-IB family hydrolase [Nocardiopsis sp. CNR-923]OLT25027.1 HAD family hydrolase [Nocardiopsis sp. CNR-923]